MEATMETEVSLLVSEKPSARKSVNSITGVKMLITAVPVIAGLAAFDVRKAASMTVDAFPGEMSVPDARKQKFCSGVTQRAYSLLSCTAFVNECFGHLHPSRCKIE